MLKLGASSSIWNNWHVNDGPRYPHAKVIQFCLRNYKPELRQKTTVLDLGCGNGVNSLFMLKEGFTVKGVDFSAEGIEKAKNLAKESGYDAEFEVAGIDQDFFPGEKFDLVVSIGVLDCAGFEVTKRAIENMSKRLNSNSKGIFIFASDLDFRLKLQTDLSIHGYDTNEVELLFKDKFKEIQYDRYVTTYESGKSQQNDWLITVKN